ncbi:CoB--CoM heterodisulfide reductase iron-sulfur subunit A family protein [Methanorbis rubei]|uniref:CoB--CoM heterodisulfide reductase iron-sulfur subunit A n=1 Tax=Methanorbis rubei TaxID=3028300 RepID=A0AAE4SBD0_9EURY|nr:Ferredoxin--NADP reductase [Methanocorpusculaceae archaeon Cs1]
MSGTDVVVIGAGVAGIQAAMDVANHNIHVWLVEREPTIGGHMGMLDKTFPTNDCSMCILSPKMAEVGRHPNITLLTLSEVEKIEGTVGDFTVSITKYPRYIREADCTGCGDCTNICPVEVYNKFDAGVGVRKAIYKPHAQVVPNWAVKDNLHCIECGLCYEVCGKNAVLHTDEDAVQTITVNAAAVVIATGYTLFDAEKKQQFGYLRYPDVITSIEFERMINAGGPTLGEVRRMSNGERPNSVVFVQCVGSRDISIGRNYCSCVCCMYALKNSMLIKEHYPDTEVTILYNDLRAYGKGYEEYAERAKQMGINIVRAFPGEIQQTRSNLVLPIEDTETGEFKNLEADLVVLSVGMEPLPDTIHLAKSLGLPLDDNNFLSCADMKLNPAGTIRPGIYIAGAAVAPKDIPDSVISGGAAAMKATIDSYSSEEKP